MPDLSTLGSFSGRPPDPGGDDQSGTDWWERLMGASPPAAATQPVVPPGAPQARFVDGPPQPTASLVAVRVGRFASP